MATIRNVIQSLSCYLSKMKERDPDREGLEYIILGLNWDNSFICLEYFGVFYKNDCLRQDDEEETLSELIGIFDKFEYECKENFIKRLNNELRTFTFMNVQVQITFYDIESDDKELFHSESCQTFREKVEFETKLNILQMLEICLSEYQAEIYIFVLPMDKQNNFQNAIFTSNFLNTSATNSFYIKIITASEIHENLSFLGHIQSDNHMFLKKCIESVADIVKKHIEISSEELFKDNYSIDHYSYKNEVIDLTKSAADTELQEKDEEIFYAIATSDNKTDETIRNKNIFEFFEKCEETENISYKKECITYQDEDSYIKKAKRSTIRQIEDRENAMEKNSSGANYFRRSFRDSRSSQLMLDQPKLNRGERKSIEISISDTARKPITFSASFSQIKNSPKLPKSNLLSEKEVSKWKESKLGNTRLSMKKNSTLNNTKDESVYNNLFGKYTKSQRDSINNFKIPKYQNNSLTPSTISNFIQEEMDVDVIDLNDNEDDKEENSQCENKRKIFKNRESNCAVPTPFSLFGSTRKRR